MLEVFCTTESFDSPIFTKYWESIANDLSWAETDKFAQTRKKYNQEVLNALTFTKFGSLPRLSSWFSVLLRSSKGGLQD